MYNYQNNTAILFFSNSVEEEIKQKQFAISKREKENRQLASLLIDHNLGVCKRTGLPVEVINTSLQRGESFGERLKNAFKDVFAKGYTNLIAVGSDCLELRPEDLKLANECLCNDEAVLGPCTDGGVYLLGLSKAQFNAVNFKSVTWGSNNVFLQLYKQVNAKWFCKIFDLKSDIDFPEDLLEIIKHKKKWFRFFEIKRIVSIVLRFSVAVVNNDFLLVRLSVKKSFQRGPPSLAI